MHIWLRACAVIVSGLTSSRTLSQKIGQSNDLKVFESKRASKPKTENQETKQDSKIRYAWTKSRCIVKNGIAGHFKCQ